MNEDSGSSESLDRRAAQDAILIAGLAAGLSHPEAGARAHMSDRTVERRLEDDEFAERVSRARWERVHRLTASLMDLGDDAIRVIRDSFGSYEKGERLRAARDALTLAIRFSQVADLDERVRRIEQRNKEQKQAEEKRDGQS